jgi:hypothetical protein
MARKKVIDLNADTTIKFGDPRRQPGALPKGSTFEGYYVGSKEVTTSMGPSRLHVFQTDKGNVGVWGSAQLNAKLQGLQGMMTFIKFVNEIKVPKGTMKNFEVEYDDEQTIDVGGAEVNFRNAGSEPEAEEEDTAAEEPAEDDAEEATEDDAEEEPAPAPRRAPPAAAVTQKPRAAAPSAEQQARVQAL